MSLRQIVRTISGRVFGLDQKGNPVWNRNDGSQIVIDADPTTGIPSVATQSANGVVAGGNLLTYGSASGTLDPTSSAAFAASGFAGGQSNGLVGLVFGDSLSSNGFGPGGYGTTAQNPLAIADAKLGGVFKRLVNGGVSGSRTDAQLAALPGYLAATAFDVVIFGPNSVNDIDGTKGTILTSDQTIANYEASIALCFNAGVKQIWLSTVHRPSTTTIGALTAAGNTTRKWYDALDTYMRNKAKADARIKVAEYCRAACNGAGTALRTNYNLVSTDLTHLGYLGADATGTAAYTPLLQQLPFTPWDMPRFNGSYRNMLGPGSSSLQGSFAAGSGNVSFGTGITGTTCPGGLFVRRQSGDSTFTGANVASITSPVGLDGQSAQMDFTIGATGGGGGFMFGLKFYNNARANSTAYTWSDRIAISSTLCGQCYTPGTSAGSAPDFSASQAGDLVQDGTVVWQVTEIPQVGDLQLFEVDMSITANTGGASPSAWLNFIGVGAETLSYWLNYAGVNNAVAWPTSTGRFLLRAVLPVPALSSGAVKTINVLAGVQGANGATGTMQLHGASIRKYPA